MCNALPTIYRCPVCTIHRLNKSVGGGGGQRSVPVINLLRSSAVAVSLFDIPVQTAVRTAPKSPDATAARRLHDVGVVPAQLLPPDARSMRSPKLFVASAPQGEAARISTRPHALALQCDFGCNGLRCRMHASMHASFLLEFPARLAWHTCKCIPLLCTARQIKPLVSEIVQQGNKLGAAVTTFHPYIKA